MKTREHYTNLIAESDASKKLIVAGAGTGKSFTFKKILMKVENKKNLVLTFINNLVDDLENDVGNFAEVRTFHSFCRRFLHEHPQDGINSNFEYYPDLINLIAENYNLLKNNDDCKIKESIEKSFKTYEKNEDLTFFLRRADYYNAVSFDDSVYRTIQILNKNQNEIPAYDTIIIDEYQDFNNLEAELLELLSTKCENILIAGDDDQSVYSFKSASPEHIRKKYDDPKFKKFSLPYCSRCTNVIVEAALNVIKKATKANLLPDRINKDYCCHIQSKNNDSQKYPHILKVNLTVNSKSSPYFAKYILSVLAKIDDEEICEAKSNNYPLALVIGPSHYLKQIEESMKSESNNYLINSTMNKTPSYPLISAMAHLYKNEKSNLGWRIILQYRCDKDLIKDIIAKNSNCNSSIYENIPKNIKKTWSDILRVLKIEYENHDHSSSTEILIEYLGENYIRHFIWTLTNEELLNETENSFDSDVSRATALSEIKLTTYVGSKGLSGGHVFIVGMEEGVFPKNNPTFDEVCQLIVSLTRARKQCHLLTVGRFAGKKQQESHFLNWIDVNNLKQIKVDKNYFSN